MKRLIFLSLVLGLSACGAGSNHNESADRSQIEISGQQPPYTITGLDDSTITVTRQDIEHYWDQVQHCLGLSAPPPLIMILDSMPAETNTGERAGYTVFFTDGPANAIIYVSPVTAAWFGVIKHEMIHYVLAENGVVDEHSHGSKHPFLHCSGVGTHG